MSWPPMSSMGSPARKMPSSMSFSYSALVHRRVRVPYAVITDEDRQRGAARQCHSKDTPSGSEESRPGIPSAFVGRLLTAGEAPRYHPAKFRREVPVKTFVMLGAAAILSSRYEEVRLRK